MGSSSLADRLRLVLPEGVRLTIHHLSTPPSRCPAIFAAPPEEEDQETYCEHQFLSVSVQHDGRLLQAFAIEVLVYTTEYLTTLFVSKADSTGYLQLLNLNKGVPSSLRIISQTFLEFLIETRTRPDRRLVLSLFARAQNQYLFPGSIENSQKHVLDDRGLIKWWCRVVNPILAKHEKEGKTLPNSTKPSTVNDITPPCQAFLRVPGCDRYETRAFLPKFEQEGSPIDQRWKVTDPLRSLGQSPDLPERCLIPRFPDDPKARFVQELDDELPSGETEGSQPQHLDRISGSKSDTGRWRSVTSLDQFWEMMSFRQECSSGRVVGFLWAVFTPMNLRSVRTHTETPEDRRPASVATLPTPSDSQIEELDRLPFTSPVRCSPPPETPSTPHSLAHPSQEPPTPSPMKALESRAMQMQPEETRQYYWPKSSRGEIVLRQKDYDRVGRLLVHLDYADTEVAAESTEKWVDMIAEKAGVKVWGPTVTGEAAVLAPIQINRASEPAMLNAGLIKKKKRPLSNGGLQHVSINGDNAVTQLPTGLVRKKPKTVAEAAPVLISVSALQDQEKARVS